MHLVLGTSTVLAVNLYFICLQVEKVVLNHLPVKHVRYLLRVFDDFVEEVVVSDFG